MKNAFLKLTAFSLFLITLPSFALCSIGTTTAVIATTTSGVLLATNAKRCGLIIINDGTVAVYVKPGSAHSGTEGVAIAASGNWEPYRQFTDVLYVKAASGSQSVRVIEWEEK